MLQVAHGETLNARSLTSFFKRWRRAILWLALLTIYIVLLSPIVAIFAASLERDQNYFYTLIPRHISLKWYMTIPSKYWHALGVSLVVATLSAVLSVVLGTMAALALVRGELIGRTVLSAFFRIPAQIPFVVTGVAFLGFYDLIAATTGIDFLGSVAGLVIAHFFVALPYSVSTVGIALYRIGPRYEEAARICGCSHASGFFRVVLPMLKPGLFAGFFYSFITSFGDVPIAVFLSNDQTTTLPVAMFQALRFDFEPALLALSALTVLMSACMILIVQRVAGLDLILPNRASR